MAISNAAYSEKEALIRVIYQKSALTELCSCYQQRHLMRIYQGNGTCFILLRELDHSHSETRPEHKSKRKYVTITK